MEVQIDKYTAISEGDRWNLYHTDKKRLKNKETGLFENKAVTTTIGFSFMDMAHVVEKIIKLEVGKSELKTNLHGWLNEYEKIKFKVNSLIPKPLNDEKDY